MNCSYPGLAHRSPQGVDAPRLAQRRGGGGGGVFAAERFGTHRGRSSTLFQSDDGSRGGGGCPLLGRPLGARCIQPPLLARLGEVAGKGDFRHLDRDPPPRDLGRATQQPTHVRAGLPGELELELSLHALELPGLACEPASGGGLGNTGRVRPGHRRVRVEPVQLLREPAHLPGQLGQRLDARLRRPRLRRPLPRQPQLPLGTHVGPPLLQVLLRLHGAATTEATAAAAAGRRSHRFCRRGGRQLLREALLQTQGRVRAAELLYRPVVERRVARPAAKARAAVVVAGGGGGVGGAARRRPAFPYLVPGGARRRVPPGASGRRKRRRRRRGRGAQARVRRRQHALRQRGPLRAVERVPGEAEALQLRALEGPEAAQPEPRVVELPRAQAEHALVQLGVAAPAAPPERPRQRPRQRPTPRRQPPLLLRRGRAAPRTLLTERRESSQRRAAAASGSLSRSTRSAAKQLPGASGRGTYRGARAGGRSPGGGTAARPAASRACRG
eukprot:5474655-Prymnesium_polylepis.1